MSMNKPRTGIRFYALAVLAYVIASFAVQGSSRFVINAAHYAEIEFMRKDPIMALGFFTMLLQGLVLAYIYPFVCRAAGSPILQGLKYGLLMGVLLGSYIAFVEPSKYLAPSVGGWIAVEGLASLAQFSLYGILLGFVYDRHNN